MKLLRRHRIANGLTQGELAKKLDVDQSTVSLWESGQFPHPSVIPKLARFLGISAMELTLILDPDYSRQPAEVGAK